MLLLACGKGPLDCGIAVIEDTCRVPAELECFQDAAEVCVAAEVMDVDGMVYAVDKACVMTVSDCSTGVCREALPCNEDECPFVTEVGVPDIRVSPEGIGFGEVAVGDVSTVVIEVFNDGPEDLEIDPIRLTEWAVPITLGSLASEVVPPCGSLSFYVEFAPEEPGGLDISVLIDSNDPDTAIVEVPVSGTAI